MEIKKITKSQLLGFMQDYWSSDTSQELSPISQLRANSLANNPLANDEDTCLILALKDGICVGYLLMIPGLLSLGHENIKVNYASSLYVSPKCRGLGIAQNLYEAAFDLQLDVIGADVSPEAANLYTKMGFIKLEPLIYYNLEFNLVGWWFRRYIEPRLSESLVKPLTHLLNYVFYFPIKKLFKNKFAIQFRNSKDFKWDTVATLSDMFLRNHTAENADNEPKFLRDKEVIDWMVRYPWITSGIKRTMPPYYFSEIKDMFSFLQFEVSNENGEALGFAIFSLSKSVECKTLKVLDSNLNKDLSGAHHSLIADLVFKNNIDRIVFLPPEIALRLKNSIFKYFLTKHIRDYFVYPCKEGSHIKELLPKLKLDCLDTDTAFW